MGSPGKLRSMAVAALALCSGCGSTRQVQVLTPYAADTLPARVHVDAVNATGRELPLPPAGLVERTVRMLTRESDPRLSVTDVFQHVTAERAQNMGIEAAASDDGRAPRLLVTLRLWDVRDGEATGAVVFVSADYQLLDPARHVQWEVRLERRPVRLSGPNLGGYDVWQVARTCTDLGLELLQGRKKPVP